MIFKIFSNLKAGVKLNVGLVELFQQYMTIIKKIINSKIIKIAITFAKENPRVLAYISQLLSELAQELPRSTSSIEYDKKYTFLLDKIEYV